MVPITIQMMLLVRASQTLGSRTSSVKLSSPIQGGVVSMPLKSTKT